MINDQIRAKEVRVIDSDGSQLGILPLAEALKLAYGKDLDLVEISPNSAPPVCRVMDYGKFRFERDKKEKEAKKKQQTIDIKEVQLSCRIDTHDFETKLKHARRFLDDGNKVKVCVKFKGRERVIPVSVMILSLSLARLCRTSASSKKCRFSTADR